MEAMKQPCVQRKRAVVPTEVGIQIQCKGG